MKKSLFILAAASAVAFAACNGGNNEGSYTKEQADSMAQAKIDSAQAALKLQNDSAMQAQAIKTADSIRIADSLFAAGKASSTKTTIVKKTSGNGKTTTHTTTEEVTTAPTTTAPAQTVGNGKPKMGVGTKTAGEEKKETVGNGKPKY